MPAPDCLPAHELADCARAVVERDGAAVLSYGPGGGYGPLREWLGERHGVDAGRVLVTNGSLQGFVFLARHLLAGAASRRVLVEAPTYDRPLKLLAELGAEVVAVPLDVDALERELGAGPAPGFLYTIPTFQNPSGLTLAHERRRRLVELAAAHDLLVLEDDPYGLVRYEGEPLPTLHELDGGGHVVYSSSFSKTVAPGLRVGYLVLPARLAPALEELAVSTYISPGYLAQATVCEFLRRGRLEANLRRVCALLGSRRDAMVAALRRALGGFARWSDPEGGYFLWLDLPAGVDAGGLLARAESRGVAFVNGSDFFPAGRGGTSSARLAFSFVSEPEIAEGIARLAELLDAPARAAAA